MSPLNAEFAWFLIFVIAAWLVLGCLKAIGYGYYSAVLWHNLKIQVHNLRIEQKRRLQQLDDKAPAPAAPQPDFDVEIVEDEDAPAGELDATPPSAEEMPPAAAA